MQLLETLRSIWEGNDQPFLIHDGTKLCFSDITSVPSINLSGIQPGSVVAIIGDFVPADILTLLRLIELGAVIVPLTQATKAQHEYFFTAAHVNFVMERGNISPRPPQKEHLLLKELRDKGHAGLVLFSSGTTGLPKAILHDFSLFLHRFATPRAALTTLVFLLFDHIGGINTLLHTLFNKGVAVTPTARTVEDVLEDCRRYKVELLPTTPTFLRLLLLSGAVPTNIPPTLTLITYGTERMDQPTLDELCRLLPTVDFRQTYGMSELGILRVHSKARDSLYMRIGGEGVETKVVDSILHIKSASRMMGYLNAPSPFSEDGWYNTGDSVDEQDGYYKITGRKGDTINVGGLKFQPADIEQVALRFPNVAFAKAYGRDNPITGQHAELLLQPIANATLDKNAVSAFLQLHLPVHMVPKRILLQNIPISLRFKKL